jgi:hypothetical protein
MNKTVVEVKSALWQKLSISLLALFFAVVGIACWIFAFQLAFQRPRPDLWEVAITGFMGLFLMAFSFGIWWLVMHYSIRADEIGISQTNGFFHQSLSWGDVAYYYMEPNRRILDMNFLYVEPVLFNSKDQIIFCAYAYLEVASTNSIDQRNELWQFVESHLQGKKIDAPVDKPFPNPFGWKCFDVNWPVKSWRWKTARSVTLILYALFWFCILMAPLLYIVSHN